jgi:anti-sigma28 factor (negative regulator of flagellin synthesis)
MKIINVDFSVKTKQESIIPAQMKNGHHSYKRASGGEDFLDISQEALTRYTKAQIVDMADQRIKKEAAEYISGLNSDNKKAAEIKALIASGGYSFDRYDLLAETAEALTAINFPGKL